MLLYDKSIIIYCLVDELLKGFGHKEGCGRKVSISEAVTTANSAALYFGGHLEDCRHFMKMIACVL